MSAAGEGYGYFWGKSRPQPDGSNGSHALVYHSLDVAAVGSVLVRDHDLPHVDPALAPLFPTLLAWHDIGKFTKTFQGKLPDLWPAVLGPLDPILAQGHDTAGYALLKHDLSDVVDLAMPGWAALGHAMLRATTGHHGRPPEEAKMPLSEREAGPVCVAAARQFAGDAFRAVGGVAVPFPGRAMAQRLAWKLAGLAVLADWIGSNEAWFAARAEPMALDRYWHEHALPQAASAVARAGVVPSRPRVSVRLPDLAPHATEPTPLQALAGTLAIAEGPMLVVIEDQTGAGKTEAALLLAHRMMRAGRGRGVFVALPTMATANAMYARLAKAYRVLFDKGEAPSLVLAHGKRGLHTEFQKSILKVAESDAPFTSDPADEPAEAQCAAWVASDRRRAFLADVGVGTIDQALLAVLPSRHAPLRLLGLAQRVLIVDEAHAYDAYMLHELETLLEFHGALGGSAIVLSATLPQLRRSALVAAFLRHAGGATSELARNDYPLVTMAGPEGVIEISCGPRAEFGRRVEVQRLGSAEDAVARVAAASRAGLAVAWVRNTVDDAIEAHAALRALGVEADLFHARFVMGDRLDIEAAAMARFGRAAPQLGRARRVLVATQVIEQSLDLDFDLMVSDLAPIDLLIQRAGRLWRHHREDRPPDADAPRLLVISPEATDDADGRWFTGPLRRTLGFYRGTVLWRTARVLFDAGAIVSPGDVRRLVEEVYADPDRVPAGLSAALDKEAGKESAHVSIAVINVLRWKDCYARCGGWDSDERTPTRLSEPSVTFRLGRWSDGVLRPFVENASPARAWALSELSLAKWRASGVPAPTGLLAAAVASVKTAWGRWEQEMPLLVLRAANAGWEGDVMTEKGQARPVIYGPGAGLLFP